MNSSKTEKRRNKLNRNAIKKQKRSKHIKRRINNLNRKGGRNTAKAKK